MIEDTSVNFGKTESWTDLSNAATAAGFTRSAFVPRSQTLSDRALIVYQNADETVGETEVTQLLARARVVLPAVMNYLYFNSTKVAVVYFGKRVVDDKKVGIRSGAEDFKIRMIRFLTAEIWPTLLRTDAPDESLGNDYLRSASEKRDGNVPGSLGQETASAPLCTSDAQNPQAPSTGAEKETLNSGLTRAANPHGMPTHQYSKETATELSWFKKSIENHMQVLLYLKKGVDGTKYLKVILNNSAHRIHFDVIDTKEEKYRWELRMLYTRLMDNLETQKAIESYEAYETNFRLACATAAANVVELERPLQAMTPVTVWGTTHHDRPTRLGEYAWSGEDTDESDFSGDDVFSARNRTFAHPSSEPPSTPRPAAATSPPATAFPPATLPQPLATTGDRNSSRSPVVSPTTGAGTARAKGEILRVTTPSTGMDSGSTAVYQDPSGATWPQLAGVKPLCGSARSKRPETTATSGSAATEEGTPVIQAAANTCKTRGKAAANVKASNEKDSEDEETGTPRGRGVPINNDTFTEHSRGATLNPSTTRYYRWMENLQRPESATLDYKSYFSHTAQEIRHRCVKFMCGFLNAYREGKLVIGVHEIPRRDAEGNLETGKGGRNNIVQHNDLIDQFVVGVRISECELEEVQEDVSEQLLCCVPPIPPQTVQIDVVPVVYPENFAYSQRVLVLYEENNYGPSRDSLKQKSNYAIRFLNPLGLSIIPMDLVDSQLADFVVGYQDSTAAAEKEEEEEEDSPVSEDGDREDSDEFGSSRTSKGKGKASQKTERRGSGGRGRRRARATPKSSPASPHEFHPDCLKAEAYVIAATGDPAALTESDWEEQLSDAIGGAKSRCHHFFMDWPTSTAGPLVVPQLHIVEVSVDIKRSHSAALQAYRGKFFSGWPSIPIWDAATRGIRRVERNYNLFGDATTTQEAALLAHSMRSLGGLTTPPSGGVGVGAVTSSAMCAPNSPLTALNTSASANNFQRTLIKYGWAWFTNLQIVNNALAHLYGDHRVRDVMEFRRVHPVWNNVFENRQGTPLVKMIHSTPVGVPMFNNSTEHISRTQYAFLHEGVPPMPLILCRIYEIIGNLPSPYPFVTVPLVQQSFRVSSFLLPIFYRQHYFDGTMRISVVLDLRDGILKTMQLRDGNLVLEAIVGMGFEKMNKRQVARQLERIASDAAERRLRQATARSGSTKPGSRSSTPRRARAGIRGMDKYAPNFLARRTLQPQRLRSARGRLSSTILSPMQSESTRLAKREVEPNIPLIHFRFLTRKLLEEDSVVVPDSPPLAPLPPVNLSAATPPPSQGQDERIRRGAEAQPGLPPRPPAYQSPDSTLRSASHLGTLPGGGVERSSWTLQHLLSWYNALIVDTNHLRVFGYCERSIAFNVSDFSEICEDDVERGALDLASTQELKFASCRANCTLHRKVLEWMEV